MKSLTDPTYLRALLSRHGFSFSKALGQNFLIDPTIPVKMAESCGLTADTGVIEVGPGVGVLTRELASRAGRVAAIELDGRLLPVLEETLGGYDNIRVIHGDVLKTDLHGLIRSEFSDLSRVVVCANLPYYITSPVIMYLLEQRLPVSSVTVMVQKEAAERICAPSGSRAAGALSLAVRYYAAPQMMFSLTKDCFMPRPQVDSAVVRLDIRPERLLPPDEERAFFKVVRAAFSQRRKTVENALSNSLHLPKDTVRAALLAAQIPPQARAETLSMEDYFALTRAVQSVL